MTTFGGSTIPPIFGGVGVDAIFIRGVGTPYQNPDGLGRPFGFLNIPPSRQAGDLLVAYATQFSGNLQAVGPSAANWTPDTIGGGGSSLSTRIADITNDGYTIPAVSGGTVGIQYFCQCIALASKDPAKTVTLFEEGPTSSFNTTTLPLTELPVGTEPADTFVLANYLHWFFANIPMQPATLNDPAGFDLIGKHATNDNITGFPTMQQFYHSGWGGKFQAVSAAVPSQVIPFTPTFNNGTAQVRSRSWRFNLV